MTRISDICILHLKLHVNFGFGLFFTDMMYSSAADILYFNRKGNLSEGLINLAIRPLYTYCQPDSVILSVHFGTV